MKTKEFSRTLTAFAELADFQCAEELYRLARVFEDGKNEMVLTRIKRMNPSARHPSTLRSSLEAIQRGFIAASAKKQAAVLGNFLKLFAGPGGSTVEHFLTEISIEPQRPIIPSPRVKTASLSVVQSIVGELRKSSLDIDAFQEILNRLNSPEAVSPSTLALIAKGVLGNGHVYRDRKTAIQAIVKRHRANATRALDFYA